MTGAASNSNNNNNISNSHEASASSGGLGKQKRQLFPEKLWDLVNNQPESGIFWSKNGKRIEIDRGQLERFLQTSFVQTSFLEKHMQHQQQSVVDSSASSSPSSSSQTVAAPGARAHQHPQSTVKFRSHNFDSFIRQLHFYGFKKSGNSYHHEKFQRDRPDALGTMKRKYSSLPLAGQSGSTTTTTAATAATQPKGVPSWKVELRTILTSPNSVKSPRRASSRTRERSSKGSRRAPVEDKLAGSPVPISPPTLPRAVLTPPPLPPPSAPPSMPMLVPPSAHKECPQAPMNSSIIGTDIKMYTIDSTGEDDFSFTNVREASVKAVRDGKSVKISIPDFVMNNQQDDSWPKTLVLENQNILSAYFIYKLQ